MPKLPERTEKNLRLWERASMACDQKETLRGCKVSFLQSVFMIENSFRPRYFRLCEYGALLATGLLGTVFRLPVRSWTVGPCQLGLPTILEYYRLGQDAGEAGERAVLPEHPKAQGEDSLQEEQAETAFPKDSAVFHQPSVRLSGFKEFLQLFSVMRLSRSMDILAWRLSQTAADSKEKYPDRPNLQLRALGTEFGGRLSYGLMAERIWRKFAHPEEIQNNEKKG
jgi:hypothetical protein